MQIIILRESRELIEKKKSMIIYRKEPDTESEKCCRNMHYAL